MGNYKRCIFHVPNHINPDGKSGSQVRPIKMLNAFINRGYEVDVIEGYGKERKEAIKRIKKRKTLMKTCKYIYMKMKLKGISKS